MPGTRLNVHLFRDSFNTPWGFRLQGGKDLNQPLTVQRVFSNSPAEGELQRGDVILSINNRDASQLTHKQAQDLIKHGGGQVQLVINRPPPGSYVGPLSPPIVTHQPRAPSLQQPGSSFNTGFQPSKVSLNKFGGGPEFGSDFSHKGFSQTPAQRYEPKHDKSAMLNRLQTSLDNLTLSPRSPEVHTSSPFYQPYGQSYQPTQPYIPTGILLEQQRLQEQHEEGEALPPVWERRRQFQQVSQSSSVRTPANKPAPRVPKPQTGPTSYGNFGIDYSHPSSQPAQSGWRPAPQFKPTPAPVHSAPAQYTPRPAAAPKASPLSPSYAPAQSTPPAWQRKEEDESGAPAWGSSLKRTGVKPWDSEIGYTNEQQPIRSVPYNPTPAKSPISAGPFSPTGAPAGGSENGPKVVHLQYNSPLHLYSNQNVAETLKGQTQAMSGQTKLAPPTISETGERDWSQSAVLKFINQEDTKKIKRPGPPVSPKPQFSSVQAPKVSQSFYLDPGASEF